MKSIVVMPAYNASKTLSDVVASIPSVIDEIILVDDASKDDTVAVAKSLGLNVFVHTQNKGYGANQKTCYKTAIQNGADFVIMVHPDGQYDPTALDMFVEQLNTADHLAVYGTRMAGKFSLKTGMPLWRYMANIFLSNFANGVTKGSLSDWHTGYRGYSKSVLEKVDYENFPDGFEFDTAMTLALIRNQILIKEVSIPIRYSPESSSISFARSLKYGMNFLNQIIRWRKV